MGAKKEEREVKGLRREGKSKRIKKRGKEA